MKQRREGEQGFIFLYDSGVSSEERFTEAWDSIQECGGQWVSRAPNWNKSRRLLERCGSLEHGPKRGAKLSRVHLIMHVG